LLSQSPEERSLDYEESIKRFAEAMGRPIDIVDYSRSGMAKAEELAQV
jgi:hypothetical protein